MAAILIGRYYTLYFVLCTLYFILCKGVYFMDCSDRPALHFKLYSSYFVQLRLLDRPLCRRRCAGTGDVDACRRALRAGDAELYFMLHTLQFILCTLYFAQEMRSSTLHLIRYTLHVILRAGDAELHSPALHTPYSILHTPYLIPHT